MMGNDMHYLIVDQVKGMEDVKKPNILFLQVPVMEELLVQNVLLKNIIMMEK